MSFVLLKRNFEIIIFLTKLEIYTVVKLRYLNEFIEGREVLDALRSPPPGPSSACRWARD